MGVSNEELGLNEFGYPEPKPHRTGVLLAIDELLRWAGAQDSPVHNIGVKFGLFSGEQQSTGVLRTVEEHVITYSPDGTDAQLALPRSAEVFTNPSEFS